MNLTEIIRAKRADRLKREKIEWYRIRTFKDFLLSDYEVRIIEDVQSAHRDGLVCSNPYPRQCGKTTAMLKIAYDEDIPLIVHSEDMRQLLKKQHRDIAIYSQSNLYYFRNSGIKRVVIDEGVNPDVLGSMDVDFKGIYNPSMSDYGAHRNYPTYGSPLIAFESWSREMPVFPENYTIPAHQMLEPGIYTGPALVSSIN